MLSGIKMANAMSWMISIDLTWKSSMSRLLTDTLDRMRPIQFNVRLLMISGRSDATVHAPVSVSLRLCWMPPVFHA